MVYMSYNDIHYERNLMKFLKNLVAVIVGFYIICFSLLLFIFLTTNLILLTN